jgi:hypothetical protein
MNSTSFLTNDPPLTDVWLMMHFDPSISAALFAPNHDDKATRDSPPTSPLTHTVMSDHHGADSSENAAHNLEIMDGIDGIRQSLKEQQDSEMADLRESEPFATPVHFDLTLTYTQRSLGD